MLKGIRPELGKRTQKGLDPWEWKVKKELEWPRGGGKVQKRTKNLEPVESLPRGTADTRAAGT